MDELTAVRTLCEAVYQRTDDRRDAIAGFDWSSMPRVRDVLDTLPQPWTSASLADAAQQIVRTAVDELEPCFPGLPDTVTSLQVVRWHVLDLEPWPSLEARLREEGRPVSRGTLIKRQHEFLPYFLEWAKRPEQGPGSATVEPAETVDASAPLVEIPAPSVATPRDRTRHRPWTLVALVLVAVFGGAAGWSRWHEGCATLEPEMESTPSHAHTDLLASSLVGRRIDLPISGGDVLPPPYPPLELPVIEGDRMLALPLAHEGRSPTLMVAYRAADEPVLRFGHWDPAARSYLWESSFAPPLRERLTHDGVGEEVLHESYWPSWIFHAGPTGDLGEYVVVQTVQRFSPVFTVFVRLDDGAVDGWYVHPGHLSRGMVTDLDLDGVQELVIGGQDNALQLPVLVVLQPGAWTGAASTVKWNVSGQESARRRIFLPDWPQARQRLHRERLDVSFLDDTSLDPATRTLTVGVASLYHIRLADELRTTTAHAIAFWDDDQRTLREHGMSLPDTTGWSSRLQVVEGIDRRAPERTESN